MIITRFLGGLNDEGDGEGRGGVRVATEGRDGAAAVTQVIVGGATAMVRWLCGRRWRLRHCGVFGAMGLFAARCGSVGGVRGSPSVFDSVFSGR